MSFLSKQASVQLRINRNIVECKCVYTLFSLAPELVLIETLWNVNRLAERASDFVDTSINRNIVECK